MRSANSAKVEIALIDIGGAVSLAHHAVAVEAVSDAGGMTHQVEHRGRMIRRNEIERGRAVLGLLLDADLHIGERGNVFRNGIVELDLAFLEQHHRGHRGDGFGHREQAEDGLVGDRRLAHHILDAEGLVIDRLAVLLDQHDGAGDLAGRNLVLEELADLGELVRIEVGACGNIKAAFRARRRCSRQRQQCTADQRAQPIMRPHQPLHGLTAGV
jgi:hypothetical protein